MDIDYKLIIERLQGWLIVQRYYAESELESDTFLNVSKYIKNLIDEEVKYNEEKQSEMESTLDSRDCTTDNIESKNEEAQSGAEEVE